MSGEKRDDALYVRESTSQDEVLRYVRQCLRSPVRYEGNVIWNFSSYEFNEEAFTSKRENEFFVPYEVPGTWGFMYALLPERVRNAEVLVYQSGQTEYIAYKNFYRQIPDLQRDEFRQSMAKLLREEVLVK